CVVMLFGVLLTFNLTLRELILGFGGFLHSAWTVAWSGPRYSQGRQLGVQQVLPAPADREALPFTPPPGVDDDMMATPIAARPTRASLFRRPETEVRPAAQAATGATEKLSSKTSPAPGKQSAAPSAPVINETVQEALEGTGVPAIHHAWPLPTLEILD